MGLRNRLGEIFAISNFQIATFSNKMAGNYFHKIIEKIFYFA